MIFNLTAKDILDIGIIAIFLYLILFLILRKKHTLFVVLGILLWYSIFFLSAKFNLILTNFIFKWFISFGLLFVLLFILAQEIRDVLYLFGSFGFRFIRYLKEKSPNISEQTIEIITDAVKEMSEKRIGALIVIEGNDPIDEFISSGYLLDGFISKPLILSIFDPTSPGHDGAMIIKNNKIYKFSTHLPLSQFPEKVKERNLRHRAGLGISEVCDCTVIIVSEETGNISLARKGEIEKIEDVFELKEKLLNLVKNGKKRDIVSNLSNLLSQNFLIFLISLALSFSLFTLINTSYALIQKTFIVPVEFINIPPNLIVKEFKPTELTMTLRGQKFVLNVLNPNELKVIVDLKNYEKYSISKWNSVLIEDENVIIKIPQNLTVVNISPSNIRFYLESLEKPKTK
jgi:diadenylate cyclase